MLDMTLYPLAPERNPFTENDVRGCIARREQTNTEDEAVPRRDRLNDHHHRLADCKLSIDVG
jgi:hypothetical protein